MQSLLQKIIVGTLVCSFTFPAGWIACSLRFPFLNKEFAASVANTVFPNFCFRGSWSFVLQPSPKDGFGSVNNQVFEIDASCFNFFGSFLVASWFIVFTG